MGCCVSKNTNKYKDSQVNPMKSDQPGSKTNVQAQQEKGKSQKEGNMDCDQNGFDTMRTQSSQVESKHQVKSEVQSAQKCQSDQITQENTLQKEIKEEIQEEEIKEEEFQVIVHKQNTQIKNQAEENKEEEYQVIVHKQNTLNRNQVVNQALVQQKETQILIPETQDFRQQNQGN